jgi:hypothetical protein
MSEIKPQIEFLGIDLTKWSSDRLFTYMIKNKISAQGSSVEYIIKFLHNPESCGYRKKYSKKITSFGLDDGIIEEHANIWNVLVKGFDYEEKMEILYNKSDIMRVYLDFKKKYPSKSHKEFDVYLSENCNSVSVQRKYLHAIGLCNLYKLLSEDQISKTVKSELNRLLVFAIDRTDYYTK